MLIVDDDPRVRSAMRTFLLAHQEFEVVGEAGSRESAERLASRTAPGTATAVPREAGDAALAHLPAARCEISRVVDSITLAEAMARLTPARREVVVHMYLHGRSPDEVSAVLGIPVGTVKSRIHSALRSHLATSEFCLAA